METLIERAVATSSSLGMGTNLIGVTLDFSITKPQWIMPFWSTSLWYDTCPYLSWLANDVGCSQSL